MIFNLIYTRPKDRGTNLLINIQNYDINIIDIPCIEFQYNFQQLIDLKDITSFDYYIFPSITAIRATLEYFINNNINYSFLNNKSVAIGLSSYKELIFYKIQNPIYPEKGGASEDLLKLDIFNNIKNKKVILLRGDVSRKYVNNYLIKKQALFTDLITYNIIKSNSLDHDILKLQSINNNNVNIILFTSISIIDSFIESYMQILDSKLINLLKNFIILVPSDRLEKYVKSKGFCQIYNSKNMTDSAIISKLHEIKKYFK